MRSFVNTQWPTETNCRVTWIVYTSVLQVSTFLVTIQYSGKVYKGSARLNCHDCDIYWLKCSIQRLTMPTETHHGYRDSPWLQKLTMVTETDHGYRDSPWLQRLAMVTETVVTETRHGYRDSPWLQRFAMVTETRHGYRDSPWLQRLTMVTETHHGYRDSQWCRVWALELTSTAVIVFSMRYRHYVMSGICTLIEMRCIFYELKQLYVQARGCNQSSLKCPQGEDKQGMRHCSFVLPVSCLLLIIFWDFYWLRATLNSWKCICT